MKLRNLTFRFAREQEPFFNDVSCDFGSGVVHVVRGRNGAGKSTLLRLLQGLVGPDEQATGTVMLGDCVINLAQDPGQLVTHVKKIVQKYDTMLADQLTGAENLSLAALGRCPGLGKLLPAHDTYGYAAQFGLDLKLRAGKLSGGQRQILAILMLLQQRPEVLLLDEPTAALDDANAKLVTVFLQRLVHEHGLVVIVITHDDLFARLCNPVGFYDVVRGLNGTRMVEYKTFY